jgi:uncharacterized OB-fold protein
LVQLSEMTIKFPYRRSLGPVIGAFMTGLTEQRILCIRNGNQVLVPPLEWDPATGKELDRDFVDVGPAGTVKSWSWVAKPGAQHPLDKPFAFALIQLDGADTSILHAVDAGSIDAMSTGMRVAPRWRAERKGHISDIEAFVPGDSATTHSNGGAEEPVTMMEYDAEITYRVPITTNAIRAEQAALQGRLLGLKCPSCGRVYTNGRGFCPIDAIALTEEHEVDLPHTGTLTNYTIITPTPYPGQTATEPFARVMIWLDGTDVVLGYQTLLDVPVEDVHIGMRVKAVWNEPGKQSEDNPSSQGSLRGFTPSGEPDVTDANLAQKLL